VKAGDIQEDQVSSYLESRDWRIMLGGVLQFTVTKTAVVAVIAPLMPLTVTV
jgi:hypothetical protein